MKAGFKYHYTDLLAVLGVLYFSKSSAATHRPKFFLDTPPNSTFRLVKVLSSNTGQSTFHMGWVVRLLIKKIIMQKITSRHFIRPTKWH